jgi:hypothetical protein
MHQGSASDGASDLVLFVSTRADNLETLLAKEKEQGIQPDPVIDAYMKASAAGKAKHSIVVRSRSNHLVAACGACLQAAMAGTGAVTMQPSACTYLQFS